jgi:hypothetical protein
MTQTKHTLGPLVCIGTTDNFHYWRDVSGAILSSIYPCSQEAISKNGLSLRFESEEEFALERRLNWEDFRSYRPAAIAKATGAA